jgi:GT2 family glycosyltransferase
MADNLNTKIDVSIVIISWQMRDLLEVCLDTLFKQTKDITFELILINNNSTDGTVEMIEEQFPQVILVNNKENRGVAPARNQGLKMAKGKYILILDADMELVDNSVKVLFDFMEATPEAGICGCKLISTEGDLQYSCKRFPTLLSFFFRRLERFDSVRNSKTLVRHTYSDWAHDEVREVDYVIGACQFFRRDLLPEVGLYDEHIFYGPEDLDFCLRMRKAGHSVFYVPETHIIHHEQRITKKKFFSKITLKHLLGILYLYKKYRGGLQKYSLNNSKETK